MFPNICTTIEQSNRILACGIDKNTADMYIDDNDVIHIGWSSNISTEKQHQYTPLWSFNALVSLFPCNLYDKTLINYRFQLIKEKNLNGDIIFEASYYSEVGEIYAVFKYDPNLFECCTQLLETIKSSNELYTSVADIPED